MSRIGQFGLGADLGGGAASCDLVATLIDVDQHPVAVNVTAISIMTSPTARPRSDVKVSIARSCHPSGRCRRLTMPASPVQKTTARRHMCDWRARIS